MRTANPKVPGRILLLIRMRYVNCHPPFAAIPLSGTDQRPFCCNPALLAANTLGKPFKEVINAALRSGLDQVLNPPAARPYRTKPRPMGLREGLNYDNIAELLARGEGEDYP